MFIGSRLHQARARLRDVAPCSRLFVPRSEAVDYDYLSRRMTEERERAAEADNDAARDAHLEMAEQYRAQIEGLDGDSGELGLAN